MPQDWKSAVRYLGGSERRERELLERLAGEIRQVVADLKADNGGVPRRALHAKPVASFANAVFRVATDLPDEWRAGILQPGATHRAEVRFSNAAGVVNPRDDAPDLRGVAFRVFGSGLPPHDWLMTNAECHHARDAAEAMAVSVSFAHPGIARRLLGPKGTTIDGIMGLVGRVGPAAAIRILGIVKSQLKRPIASLATEQYWSRAPIRIHDVAMRYHLAPVVRSPHVEHTLADLTAEFRERIAAGDVRFLLQVQPYVDEATTPLENASAPWRSSPETIAELTLPQGTDFAAGIGDDAEAFSPWQVSDPAFEPLGSMNRARRIVYPAAVEARTK